ncbi:hypothetical protein BKA24_000719 [Microbacterium marinum]|uniref:Uncharacterized protein n=1 Tax=Microbacterium marinum TaxID=421115 RepID=A0A7W7BNQ6_9MICO|nr:hypothetical protein [Microbacterium marinum]MBB4666010.1 hypothetical protein [Microbacterium marinum]
MTAISLRPDDAVWSEVPEPEHLDAWLRPHVDAAPAERRGRVVDAALLAARTRLESDASIVLFLDIAHGVVLSALAVYAWDDVPAPGSAEKAAEIGVSAVPTSWDADTHEIELGPWAGWRVTILDDAAGPGPAMTASTAWTVYVLDVAGRCVVAVLAPLPPEAAVLAQHHSEHALATLEIGTT